MICRNCQLFLFFIVYHTHVQVRRKYSNAPLGIIMRTFLKIIRKYSRDFVDTHKPRDRDRNVLFVLHWNILDNYITQTQEPEFYNLSF